MYVQAHQINSSTDDATLIAFLTTTTIDQYALLKTEKIKIWLSVIEFVPIKAIAPNHTREQVKNILKIRWFQIPENKTKPFITNILQKKNLPKT